MIYKATVKTSVEKIWFLILEIRPRRGHYDRGDHTPDNIKVYDRQT